MAWIQNQLENRAGRCVHEEMTFSLNLLSLEKTVMNMDGFFILHKKKLKSALIHSSSL